MTTATLDPPVPSTSDPRPSRAVDQRQHAVQRAIDTIEADPGAPLSTNELARVALYSRFHFIRIFLAATGITPSEYVRRARIKRACVLLATTSLSVTDITLAVGYTSIGTFSSWFGRELGMSPSNYRRVAAGLPAAPSRYRIRRTVTP